MISSGIRPSTIALAILGSLLVMFDMVDLVHGFGCRTPLNDGHTSGCIGYRGRRAAGLVVLSLSFTPATKNRSACGILEQQQPSLNPVGTCLKMRVLWLSYALYAQPKRTVKPGHPSLPSIELLLRAPQSLRSRPKLVKALWANQALGRPFLRCRLSRPFGFAS